MYRCPHVGAGFPSRGSFALVLLVALVCPARADVTMKEKTVSSGLGGFGDGTTLQTTIIAGDRSRSDDEFTYTGRFKTLAGGGKARHSSHITRLDRECVWSLDDEKKTYTELTFAQMRELMSKGLADAEQAQAEARRKPGPESADVEYKVDVQRTGKKQQMNGFLAEQVIVTVTGTPKDPQSGETASFTLVMDQWLTPSLPGQSEVTAFWRRYAEKMGIEPELRRMGGAMMAQYGDALKKAAEKFKDVKGYPVHSETKILAGPQVTPEQQAQIDKARAESQAKGAEKKQKETERKDADSRGNAAGSLVRGDVGGAIGGLLGRRVNKAVEKKAEQAEPRPDGTGGALMTVVSDVLSVSTGPAAGVSFDVPAGYKKIERK